MDANIIEIAKRAGVSIATVSRAMNGNGSIKESTRNKILRLQKNWIISPIPWQKVYQQNY